MPDEQKPLQTPAIQPSVDDVHPEPPVASESSTPAISMPPNQSSGTAADIPVEPVHIDLGPTPSTPAAPVAGGQPFGVGSPAGVTNVPTPAPQPEAPSQASKKLVLLFGLVILGLAVAGGVTVAALSRK